MQRVYRIFGPLEVSRLSESLNSLIAKHHSLRTVIINPSSPVRQHVECSTLPFLVKDLSIFGSSVVELEDALRREAGRGFGFDTLLVRAALFRLAHDEHVFVFSIHHIICDGTSLSILERDLSRAYNSSYLPSDPGKRANLPNRTIDINAADLNTGRLSKPNQGYWHSVISGLDFDDYARFVSSQRPEEYSCSISFLLQEGLALRLLETARKAKASPFAIWLTAWGITLYKLRQIGSFVIAVPFANRETASDLEAVGLLANLLPLRFDINPCELIGSLIRTTSQRLLNARLHQSEDVVAALLPRVGSRRVTHLFDSIFSFSYAVRSGLTFTSLRSLEIDREIYRSRAGLALQVTHDGAHSRGQLIYSDAVVPRPLANALASSLIMALEAVCASQDLTVRSIDLLGSTERELLLETWNRTEADYPSHLCVHELFEQQAARTPDAVAVVAGDTSLSYGELNARANQLARRLQAQGLRPDERVAICVERSLEMVVGLLAILKAGGAYVPLDPAYPTERLAFMLCDSAPRLALTHPPARQALDNALSGLQHPPALLDLCTDAALWSATAKDNLDPTTMGLAPDNLAYVIYTSGSTGTPKGVMVEHRNLVCRLGNWTHDFGSISPIIVPAITSPSFDPAGLQVFLPIVSGGHVLFAEVGTALLQGTNAIDFTYVVGTPSTVEALVDNFKSVASIRSIALGGEPPPRALVSKLRLIAPSAAIYNVYGPTEATIFSLSYHISDADQPCIPIGRPISNTRIYILAEGMEPVPLGAVGEIYIGGAGVARGYLNRPELTAERFLSSPFVQGDRLYRTGDLGRYLPDGNIEFLGRNDHQVKIRGFRIELGEIEARLAEHPQVREAVVVAREAADGDKRLVAYYTAEPDAQLEAADLRSRLAAALPDHMVPAAFVSLQTMPLTPNGKLDRKALPDPGEAAYARQSYEPPQGEVEQALAAIWAELLGVERVGRHDNFFELGGHSLLAVRMVSRLQQQIGLAPSLATLFAHPTLSALAASVGADPTQALPPITPAPRSSPLPLSFSQERLWFLTQLDAASPYNIPVGLKLHGVLDQAALERALDTLVERHEALRARFMMGPAGEPEVRHRPPETGLKLQTYDLRTEPDRQAQFDRLAAEEARIPFDLSSDPLLRGRLIRLGDQHHVLLLTMHHIVSDGWSVDILLKELDVLYGAFSRGGSSPLAPLALQYADYAAWQRRWLQGGRLEQQQDYWRNALADAPVLLEIPTDYPRPPQQDFEGGFVPVELDAELSAALRQLAQQHGVTLYIVLLAAWAVVLGRLCGQPEVIVGSPTANRNRREVEDLVGLFVNTLALRINVAQQQSVSDLLKHVRDVALGAQDHQELPFEQVVEIVQPPRRLDRSPLVQAMFAWQNTGGQGARTQTLGELTLAPQGIALGQVKFDLDLALGERGDRIMGAFGYAKALFDVSTVERHRGYLVSALRAMAADAGTRLGSIDLLGSAERELLLETWNRTEADYPSHLCVHELFEQQAARTPDAVAVVAGDASLSYGELNARANQLARRLQAQGLRPDERVAICVERSLEMVVGLLAILKAGGAYVPLDPAYPTERLAFMLCDSAPRLALTHPPARQALDNALSGLQHPPALLDLCTDAALWSATAKDNLDPTTMGLAPDNLAYVIYTSGSTGTPKGILTEHSAVVCRIAWMQTDYPISVTDSILFKTTICFDDSVLEVFWTLSTGASLVALAADEHRSIGAIVDHIQHHQISVLHIVPSVLAALVDGSPPRDLRSLRTIFCSGEDLRAPLIKRLQASAPEATLHNLYGPTEAAVDVTAWQCPPDFSGDVVPIGRPISNTRIYILAEGMEPVPLGAVGEIYIGGAGVARGYLNRPELTAERFLSSPFVQGDRLYRTGDLGRYLPDGNIEFLGRNDHQVKIRGFRIELGEIEARLAEHPQVREAVVVAREAADGDKRLVAYYTAEPDAQLEAADLRSRLAAALPDHMVPAAFVSLQTMPLTPNGKLDRKALPDPGEAAYARQSYEPPQGEVEQALAAIWAELLGVERVGRHDNFFELGGHSLLAVRMVSRLQQQIGLAPSLATLFAHPTLSALAASVGADPTQALPPITPAPRSSPLPLSFSQERLWFLTQLDAASPYNIPVGLKLHGVLDQAALERALDTLVERHEALRARFMMGPAGEPEVRHRPPETGLKLQTYDLRTEPDRQAQFDRLAAEEARIPFDLSSDPLLRGRLIRLGDQHHVLLLTMHHIVSDGWSVDILLKELDVLYGAFSRGGSSPLAPLALQYADYAAWQRRWLQGGRLEQQQDYWRNALADAPVLLEIPTDYPRPPQQDFEGGFVPVELDAELSAALRQLAQQHGVTLYIVLLAAWAVVLGRLCGQPEVIVGSPTANRNRREVEDLVGLFVNTLALRINVAQQQSVSDLLKHVRDVALGAQDHQELPFEQVVEIVQPPRRLDRSPLVQAMFAWQSHRSDKPLTFIPGLPTDGNLSVVRFELTLTFWESDGVLRGSLGYMRRLFFLSTIERYADYVYRALRSLSSLGLSA